MSEKNAHQFLLAIRQPGDRIDRIENVLTQGMPDVNGCFSGHEFWIETKQPRKEPKRISTPLFGSNHNLSLEQRNWILTQRNAGGNAIVYIQTKSGLRMFIGGEHADCINAATLPELGLMAFWRSDAYPRDEQASSARWAIIKYCGKTK